MDKNTLTALVVIGTIVINLLSVHFGIPATVSCTVSGFVKEVHAMVSNPIP